MIGVLQPFKGCCPENKGRLGVRSVRRLSQPTYPPYRGRWEGKGPQERGQPPPENQCHLQHRHLAPAENRNQMTVLLAPQAEIPSMMAHASGHGMQAQTGARNGGGTATHGASVSGSVPRTLALHRPLGQQTPARGPLASWTCVDGIVTGGPVVPGLGGLLTRSPRHPLHDPTTGRDETALPPPTRMPRRWVAARPPGAVVAPVGLPRP